MLPCGLVVPAWLASPSDTPVVARLGLGRGIGLVRALRPRVFRPRRGFAGATLGK